MNVLVSNGRNCSTCDKQNVCKYVTDVSNQTEAWVNQMSNIELPLSININCREWDSARRERDLGITF